MSPPDGTLLFVMLAQLTETFAGSFDVIYGIAVPQVTPSETDKDE